MDESLRFGLGLCTRSLYLSVVSINLIKIWFELQVAIKSGSIFRSSCPEVFYKNVFIKISQNSLEKTSAKLDRLFSKYRSQIIEKPFKILQIQFFKKSLATHFKQITTLSSHIKSFHIQFFHRSKKLHKITKKLMTEVHRVQQTMSQKLIQTDREGGTYVLIH